MAALFAASTTDEAEPVYGRLMENYPDHLACLLNITTAMEQVFLPQGTPLSYFKHLDLPDLAADRIFGYAAAELVHQVKLAAEQRKF